MTAYVGACQYIRVVSNYRVGRIISFRTSMMIVKTYCDISMILV